MYFLSYFTFYMSNNVLVKYAGRYFMLFVLLAGCMRQKCDDCLNQPAGSAFFPTEVGRFVEYNIREEAYTLDGSVAVRQYQLKEVVAERYTDPTGEAAYRIARFRRSAEGQRWQADSTITLRLLTDHAVRNENGKDYVKMVFPPQK